jgi:uncharacterized protein
VRIEGERGPEAPMLPHLVMPPHHEVRAGDVMLRRLHGALAAAAERGPEDFAELLLVPGVGPRTVRALAMVAEVIHGTPCRFADPARFSLAHGGKDGHPFPVPTRVYDRTIAVLRAGVERARLGDDERMGAMRRLDAQARALERAATGPSLLGFVEAERRESHLYGGQTVFGQTVFGPAAAPAAGDGRASADRGVAVRGRRSPVGSLPSEGGRDGAPGGGLSAETCRGG